MSTTALKLLLAAAAVCALPKRACTQETGTMHRHPVLVHGIDSTKAADYEKAVARVLAMSEEQMLSFLPERHDARFCECPNCYGGVQGNGVLAWSIDRPDELKCKYCGTLVHPNPAYAETETLVGRNRLGETITHRYYLSPERQRSHFFTDHLMMYKRHWLLEQCRALGRAYRATGKAVYARRVVLVLDRIAEVYAHYAVMEHGSMPVRRFAFAASQEPPYRWDAGRWGWHSPSDDVPVGVTECYDLVYDSDAFDELSRERGYDVRERFENDFMRDIFAAVSAAPSHVTNYVAYLGGVVSMGRVIGDPRLVHWAFQWIRRNVDAGCFYDGMWHESPSYHYMTIGGLRRCFDSLRGYSDPAGYVDPADGTRFDNLVPETAVPLWAKVPNAAKVLDFPDGCATPVHDTWANTRTSPPRERTVSSILPGFGHLSLGRGAGPDQMQAQLHFSGAYGHHHGDNLNLSLYAKGMEMLSDIGYTWTNIRNWTTSTISHNTVAVDGKEQAGADGNLLWFFPDTGGVAVAEAEGRRAYAHVDGLDRYRRLLVMIPVSDADAYVVDLFRTRGGGAHDWLAHGDADDDMVAACSLPMAAAPAPFQGPDAGAAAAYERLRDVHTATTEDAFTVTFSSAADQQRGVRIHLLGGVTSEVFLGQSPSVRRAGTGAAGDNRKALDYWMPHLVIRRRGEAPLTSLFAAVEEPWAGSPFLDQVMPVALSPADPAAVALSVRHGEVVDTIISTLDEPPYPARTTPTGITLKGRLGVVRQRAGATTDMWLYEGDELALHNTRLDMPASRYDGRIHAATRTADGAAHDAFLTTAELPVGESLRGAWMIVTHGNGCTHGYCIDRVERAEGGTQIILNGDHGLIIEDNQTREAFFPQRTIAGENRFVIPRAASLSRTPEP